MEQTFKVRISRCISDPTLNGHRMYDMIQCSYEIDLIDIGDPLTFHKQLSLFPGVCAAVWQPVETQALSRTATISSGDHFRGLNRARRRGGSNLHIYLFKPLIFSALSHYT